MPAVVAVSGGLDVAGEKPPMLTRTYLTVLFAREQEQIAHQPLSERDQRSGGEGARSRRRDVTTADVARSVVIFDWPRRGVQATRGSQACFDCTRCGGGT
jgi:hypothetical protein